MVNPFYSMRTKLTASFILLILVVISATFISTFGETKNALRESVRTELTAVAAMISVSLQGPDADLMDKLRPGDESSAAFIHLRDRLRAFRDAHPDIKYIYTMRRVGGDVQFMVDADNGNQKDPGAAIGEKYDLHCPDLLLGFDHPAADRAFTTDKWGVLLSGYAPLKDSRGEAIGLVGVDMAGDLVLRKQHYIGNTIFAVMGLGILVAAIFIFIFSQTLSKDIRKLNSVANAISHGDLDVEMDVERADEIGELADSFGRMVASLKIVMKPEDAEADEPHERAS